MRTALAGLYIALLCLANPGLAGPEALEALKDGDMRKLVLHDEPVGASHAAFEAVDGSEMTLADYHGQIVVLNFWATWCAPCRVEMPTLDALAGEMGDELAVVTIATGRNPPEGMRQFFEEAGVTRLPLHRDPRQVLAREMGVLGLPVTLILDREGREIGRLTGEADWSSESAMAILSAIAES